MTRTPSSLLTASPRRAFTLFELLVVLIIIGTVMAILVPSLGGTRRAAKKVSSLSLMNNLASATGQFITDKRTPPGHFPAVDMGAQANLNKVNGAGRGFAAIQNVMIDLAGGITSATEDGEQILKVGPTNSATVNIDITQIGGASSAGANNARAYFTPGQQFMAAQRSGQVSASSADNHNNLLPTLVDSFGNPLLAWAADERGSSTAAWAALDSTTVARYYWAANGCFLSSARLGKNGANQLADSAYNNPSSLLGGDRDPGNSSSAAGAWDADQIHSTLMALLGHPAFPGAARQELLGAGFAGSNLPLPGAPRGTVLFHSAGSDGVFLSTFDRGGKLALNTDQRPGVAAKYTGGVDPMLEFDDITVPAGN